MAAGDFVAGLRGRAMLDTLALPVLPGSTFSLPLNYQIPQVFSGANMHQFVRVEGMQYPVGNLTLYAAASWLTKDNLQKWFVNAMGVDDVADAGPFKFFDGSSGKQCASSKINILRIGGSFGDLLRIQMTILGYGTVTDWDGSGAQAVTANPIAFQHLTFAGGLSTNLPTDKGKAVTSFDLVLSNNLDVNPSLNATPFPVEHNKGQFTATTRIVQQASANRLADGTSCDIGIITNPATGAGVKVTVRNPLCLDPNERAEQFPRAMREYNYACLGVSNAGSIDPPILFDDLV